MGVHIIGRGHCTMLSTPCQSEFWEGRGIPEDVTEKRVFSVRYGYYTCKRPIPPRQIEYARHIPMPGALRIRRPRARSVFTPIGFDAPMQVGPGCRLFDVDCNFAVEGGRQRILALQANIPLGSEQSIAAWRYFLARGIEIVDRQFRELSECSVYHRSNPEH